MRPRLKLVHVLFLLVTIGVLARLYHIDAPLMEYRIMRQNDNAALARNFHQEGMNIFYPLSRLSRKWRTAFRR